jgi:hypothetical protein
MNNNMRKILSLIIIALTLYSCAEPNEQKTNKTHITEEPKLLVDTVEIENKTEEAYLRPYLEITALNKDWPSTSATDEINWKTDSVSQSYTRKYYPLDTLIEGRPVFADSSEEQFFFYFPYNKCWTLNAEFPDSSLIKRIKQKVGNDFSAIIEGEDYYRFGYEYGSMDTWDLEKIVFSKAPWDNDSSIYQLKWVGTDPMMELKKDWEIRHKTELYKDWLAAYDKFKKDTSGSALFIPKPITIDYAKTLTYRGSEGLVLREYLIDQYKLITTEDDRVDIKLTGQNIEYFMQQLVTINEDGDSVIADRFSHGLTLKVKLRQDTLILPEVASITEIYGSKISYKNNKMTYDRIMADKAPNEIGYHFAFPMADINYLSILLEFLYGDTYVTQGHKKLIERASTMPTDPESYMDEGGCWIEVNSNSIDVLCSIGGC